MDRQKIFHFLLLTFGLGLITTFLPYWFLDPQSIIFPFVWSLGFSWSPALAAIITQKYIHNGSMARYGWNRKRFSFRWIGLTAALPFVVIVGSITVVLLLGNALHIPGFGEVILSKAHSDMLILHLPFRNMDPLLQWLYLEGGFDQYLVNQGMGMPGELWSILAMLAAIGTISGLTFGLLFTVGEEVGWRGFMLTETRSMGFIESNFIIGALWGAWNLLPFLSVFFLFGDSLFGWDYLWEMLAIMGYGIAASFPLAWMASRTRSIYASATFQSVMNNVSGLSMIFLFGGHPLLSSPTGLAGMLILLLISFFIIRFDRKFVENYPKLFY